MYAIYKKKIKENITTVLLKLNFSLISVLIKIYKNALRPMVLSLPAKIRITYEKQASDKFIM